MNRVLISSKLKQMKHYTKHFILKFQFNDIKTKIERFSQIS